MSALRSVSLSLKNPTAKMMTKRKHKKLDEDWFETKEHLQDGMRFSAKYLGKTAVVETNDDNMLSIAVQRIITMAKGTKKPMVHLVVSSNGIQAFEPKTTQLLSDISIHRISYCAALKNHLKVFSFVAQSLDYKIMECHAYLCCSPREAQSLTFTVAQSFKVAFEIGEEKSKENEENIDSNFIDLGKTNQKTSSVTIPNVSEKRYQRFSSENNPFDISDSESKSENFAKNGAEETNRVGDVFLFSPVENEQSSPFTSKTDVPITPLKPPPSKSGDKTTQRRTTHSSVVSDVLVHDVGTPPQTNPVHEDFEKDFLDLALSRTQKEDQQAALQNVIYPPSNPFFCPSNPFHS